MREMKKAISEKFDVKDMGELHHFLGVKIIQKQKSGEIWIGQSIYAKELLTKFRMEQSKPAETPFDAGSKLAKAEEGENSYDQEVYQSAVGSLLYLSTRTRPDIAYAVGNIARFSAKPTNHHWTAVKRLMRYLNGTLNLGLQYGCNKEMGLVGYSDADWAGDLNDRKSTSGYIFQISGAAVSWRSKKQTCVALSTTEAEYMALASALQEAVWMRQLISDIHGQTKLTKPTQVYEDNQSAICMAKNQQYHGRSKHIDIKFHFVREQVATGSIELKYCRSEDMIADILTKGLCGPQFKKLRLNMGMKPELNLAAIEEEC